MIGKFEELLHALGKVFRLQLHIDKSGACTIQVHDALKIQLQPDVSVENLWIFAKVVEIPPGKFRENVLRETLKANGQPDPRSAIFGFIGKESELALFQKYPLELLDGEKLAGYIGAFLETANSWQKAIAAGQAAPQKP